MVKLIKWLRYYFYNIINNIIFYINNIVIDSSFKITGILYIKNKGICKIGKNFKCNSGRNYNTIGGDTILRLVISKGSMLNIGNNVGISNTTIYVANKITIGDNVLIGGGCKIWDTDFHSLDPYIRIIKNDEIINTKPIIIKNNVFIGGNSIILKGVTIGENSIVGAGSIVTKDVPKNEIWAGNPAKFIKKILL
jgi:acetyltransferase-like isoleucine patch superfamily enzyme